MFVAGWLWLGAGVGGGSIWPDQQKMYKNAQIQECTKTIGMIEHAQREPTARLKLAIRLLHMNWMPAARLQARVRLTGTVVISALAELQGLLASLAAGVSTDTGRDDATCNRATATNM